MAFFDDDDDFKPEELDLAEEWNVFSRSGFLDTGVFDQNVFNKKQYILDNAMRFHVYVDACAKKFIEEKTLPFLNYDDVSRILDSLPRVKNLKYKNPTCFVIGYSLTKSRFIDEKLFKIVAKKIKSFVPKIQLADVIRYANLWITLRK